MRNEKAGRNDLLFLCFERFLDYLREIKRFLKVFEGFSPKISGILNENLIFVDGCGSHLQSPTTTYIAIYPYIATYDNYHFSLTTYPLLFIYTILIQGNFTFFTTFSRLSSSCFSFTFSPNQCAIASDPVRHPTTALAATSAVIGMAYVYID